MGFDSKAFIAAKLHPRKEAVDVPALASWFEKGSKPEWVVRGLTASEIATASTSQARQKNVGLIVEALATVDKTKRERIKEIQEALGFSDDVPGEVIKRMEMLVMGSLEPVITMEIAIKLANTFPIEFFKLTNTITDLSGQGQELQGKLKPSGETKASEQA